MVPLLSVPPHLPCLPGPHPFLPSMGGLLFSDGKERSHGSGGELGGVEGGEAMIGMYERRINTKRKKKTNRLLRNNHKIR